MFAARCKLEQLRRINQLTKILTVESLCTAIGNLGANWTFSDSMDKRARFLTLPSVVLAVRLLANAS